MAMTSEMLLRSAAMHMHALGQVFVKCVHGYLAPRNASVSHACYHTRERARACVVHACSHAYMRTHHNTRTTGSTMKLVPFFGSAFFASAGIFSNCKSHSANYSA